jgi:hypothetical protein
MGHFAKVNNGIVEQVIVAEPDFFNNFIDSSPGEWIQTSYNTHGGIHLLGGTPLRKNFAAIGYSYNKELDAFISPKPFNSWILDESTCFWNPPLEYPQDEKLYIWNEEILNWEEVINPLVQYN